MSAITQSYKIDMTSGAVPLRIKVSQYDAGIRTLTFALFNLGTKLTSAQLSSLTAYVQGTKQDKKGFEYECTADFSAEGCSVTVAITEQMTACAGDVVCELVLVADDDRIGTANFVLEVERAALGADTDISETELPDIITAGRQYAAQAEDAAERAEEAAAGVDNYALAGAGMMTEYSAGVIDTNIYLHREPKIGDRLLIMFTQTFTQSTPIKIYKENGGTAYTLNFDLWDSDYVLKGLCLVEVVDFLDNFALRWLHSYSGTEYQAGQYIGISGNYINNIAPQLGDNSEYHEKDSAITDGDLGAHGYYAKYIIINFKARAVPNDTTGKYSLQLSKGATLEDASLVDRDGNDFTAPIKAGAILLCSVDNSNDIVTVLNNDIMANGDIIDGQGNTLSVLAEALTKTASGNPVVIDDCAGGKARSLITSINAIQDLHGQPFPYVGGAYKNKLPMTVASIKALNTAGTWSGNVYTWNGNTFEILTDSANNVIGIKVGGNNNGTACRFQLCDEGFIGDGSYYLNGSSADFSGGQTQLYTKYSASDYAVSYNGADTPFTVSGGYTIGGVYILVDANITFSSPIIYKPMIRLATESDASFAPYSNICPISGRTEARVDDVGKNQLPMTVASIKAANTEGTWDGNIYTVYGCTYEIITDNELVTGILVKGTSTVNMSFWLGAFNYKANDTLKINSGVNTGNDNIYFRISGSGKYVYTIQVTSKGSDTTYTGNADVEFWGNIRIGSNIALPSSGLLFKPSLVFGTDSTAFEPYAHSSVIIQLGQIIYGGILDWNTGILTLIYAFIIYDGSSDEGWSASVAGSGTGYRCRTNTPTGAKIPSNNGETANIVCNQFKADTANRTYTGNEGISIQNGGGNPLDVYSVSFNTSDISLWKTYLSNNPLQVCYELAIPITIQLTPTQLQMLKGYNRVTVDDGMIELGYISKIA